MSNSTKSNQSPRYQHDPYHRNYNYGPQYPPPYGGGYPRFFSRAERRREARRRRRIERDLRRAENIYQRNRESGILFIIILIVGLPLAFFYLKANHQPSNDSVVKTEIKKNNQPSSPDNYRGGDMHDTYDEDVGSKSPDQYQESHQNTTMASMTNDRRMNEPPSHSSASRPMRTAEMTTVIPRKNVAKTNSVLYYVQITASKSYDAAESRIAKEEDRYSGQLHLVKVDDGTRYPFKVICGPYASPQQARSAVRDSKAMIRKGTDKDLIFIDKISDL